MDDLSRKRAEKDAAALDALAGVLADAMRADPAGTATTIAAHVEAALVADGWDTDAARVMAAHLAAGPRP